VFYIRISSLQRSHEIRGFSCNAECFLGVAAFEIPGLERAKDVWGRVRARVSNGAGPWSDPATTLVN